MNISGKDNKELNISFDNSTLKVNENAEYMYERLTHLRQIRSNARASEPAEMQ